MKKIMQLKSVFHRSAVVALLFGILSCKSDSKYSTSTEDASLTIRSADDSVFGIISIMGTWHGVTTMSNEEDVIYKSCDYSDIYMDIDSVENNIMLTIFDYAFPVKEFIATDFYVQENTVFLYNEDSMRLSFTWTDKSKHVIQLHAVNVVGDDYTQQFVLSEYRDGFETYSQPCAECKGTACENLTDRDHVLIKKFKGFAGTWVFADTAPEIFFIGNTFHKGDAVKFSPEENLHRGRLYALNRNTDDDIEDGLDYGLNYFFKDDFIIIDYSYYEQSFYYSIVEVDDNSLLLKGYNDVVHLTRK